MCDGSGSLIVIGTGLGCLSLELEPSLSRSLSRRDLLRVKRPKGFDLPFFDEEGWEAEGSKSAAEAIDTSDLDGKVGAGFWTAFSA